VELICSEVWGGNRSVNTSVKLPGMTGWAYSSPCDGSRGGDVHYLSTCGAGLISRIVLADVVGHGQQVAQMSGWIHGLLRRYINDPNPERMLSSLNQQICDAGFRALTTAAFLTYYAPTGVVRFGYAGHPPALLRRGPEGDWMRLEVGQRLQPRRRDPDPEVFFNMPLGVDPDTCFEVGQARLEAGDRLVVFSDGVLETPSPEGGAFAEGGLQELLDRHQGLPAQEAGPALLDGLHRFAGRDELAHDDISLILLDAGERPSGPKMLHMLRNRARQAYRRLTV